MELQQLRDHYFSHSISSDDQYEQPEDNNEHTRSDVLLYDYHSANEKDRKVLDWLAPCDPSYTHERAYKQFHEGTLGWFFGDERFLNWHSGRNWVGSGPQTLWCRGEAGVGKTTLVAQIARYVRKEGALKGDLAVVYCRHFEKLSQSTDALMASILAQLYQRDGQGFDIPSEVESATRQPAGPDSSQLEQWLIERIQGGRPVFIILDAVDELSVATRRQLFLHLHQLASKSLKLLVTSQDLPTSIGQYYCLDSRSSAQFEAGKLNFDKFVK